MNEKKSRAPLLLTVITPFSIACIFTLLNIFPVYRVFENKIFDFLLHIKPAVNENGSILLLEIDDESIANVGLYPWPRDMIADGLVTMKEFGARYAVFDIEFVDRSPVGLNASVLESDVPRLIESEFAAINESTGDLFESVRKGLIPLRDASAYVRDLASLTLESKERILGQMARIARDNDEYLGETARFFGKAFFTINMLPDLAGDVSDELLSYTETHIALPNISVLSGAPPSTRAVRPAILPILSRAAGAGFPNVDIDPDGTLRRIGLLKEYNGKHYAQLAVAPVLDILGNPAVKVETGRITLEKAALPGETALRNITIPLVDNGFLLFNWPKKKYEDSFRHLSFYRLVQHARLETSLTDMLRLMKESNYLSYYKRGTEEQGTLLEQFLYAKSIKEEVLAGGDLAKIDEYVTVRNYFFEEANVFLDGRAEKALLDDLDRVIGSGKLPDAKKKEYEEIRAQVPSKFAFAKEINDGLAAVRRELTEKLPGSICFIGWTGTSTTDIGVTAFSEKYMNVGVHATVMNSILENSFLLQLPFWVGGIIAAALSLLVVFVIKTMQPTTAIITGAGFVAGILVLPSLAFCLTGVYPGILTPALAVFSSFIVQTFVLFLQTAKEKSFIRNAFSRYLSKDVISELVNDPSKLKLGGDKKILTAMFTDIRGFSTISEVLDPADLVSLLNRYLTEMSNIILGMKGTIDKYEGDAIIAFFGAPIVFDDHAHRACFSAIMMKRMEKILNEHLVREKLSPSPLFTRIGINTGEMVVGNMGTLQKMDYTIMGNSVNLAARLEGVNKQYGTAIIASETTHDAVKGGIFTRRLDRVRVIGINKPVRLYEIIEEAARVTPEVQEGVDTFHAGIELFERKEWTGARESFEAVRRLIPDDGPSDTFIRRCDEYIKKPPADNWDGVFSLTTK